MPPESRDSSGDSSDRTICFCYCVQLSDLRAAIRAGATTLRELQAETLASTGCGGCEYDVREILQDELKKLGK